MFPWKWQQMPHKSKNNSQFFVNRCTVTLTSMCSTPCPVTGSRPSTSGRPHPSSRPASLTCQCSRSFHTSPTSAISTRVSCLTSIQIVENFRAWGLDRQMFPNNIRKYRLIIASISINETHVMEQRIFSFGIKEQLMRMLQNVNDANKRVHPHCSGV